MGLLSETRLDELIAAGCSACSGKKLAFRTFIDGRLPLLAGEPVGAITWVYDGEKFVDGVFEVACADCKQVVFTADVCPRCHAAGGLATALATPNSWPVPRACPGCDGEEVLYRLMVPARVSYEGKRADKPRTTTDLFDVGAHGLRVDCTDCGIVAELKESCPLCGFRGELRARPG